MDIIVHDISKITDIKYERMEYDNYFIKKFCPINKHSDIPLHKFWFIAEKCKVVNNARENFVAVFANKSRYLSDKLEIENKIRTHFKKKLHTESDVGTLCKFLYDSSTVFFNQDDIEEKCQIMVGNEFDLIVELNYIELCSTHINFIWKVVQMKKIKMIDLKVSLFLKKTNNDNKFVEKIESHTRPSFVPALSDLHLTKKNVDNNVRIDKPTNNQPMKPTIIAFTPDLLQSALSKLKKPKTTDEVVIDIPIKNDEIMNQISGLKHVDTQESSIIEIFKKEHKEKIRCEYIALQRINYCSEIIFCNMNQNILCGLNMIAKIHQKKIATQNT